MKSERGVTLMMVVIEIVVLVIIIAISFGRGSKIEKPVKMASTTQSQNKVAKDKEQIEIAFSEFAGFSDFSPEDIKAKLEEVNKDSVIQVELIGEEDYSISIDGRKYEVNMKEGGTPTPVN